MNINQSLRYCNLPIMAGVAVVSMSLSIDPAFGQNEGLEITKVEGALEDMGGYQMKVKPEEGDSVIVAINPQKTDFEYTGTAEREFLVPGLMVRFTAAFDVNGKPQSELKEIEIFSPARKRRMTNEYMRDQTAGIYPIEEAAEDGDKKTKDKAAKTDKQSSAKVNNAAAATGGVMEFRIVGKLTGMDANVIQVAAGNRPVMIQLADEVKISVAAGDTTFCVAGDKVAVTGLTNAAQPNYVEAEKITVTSAKPLGPAKPTDKAEDDKGRRSKQGKTSAAELKAKKGSTNTRQKD